LSRKSLESIRVLKMDSLDRWGSSFFFCGTRA
jgi:hypothetical protein